MPVHGHRPKQLAQYCQKGNSLTTKNIILAVSWLAGLPFYDDDVCLEVFW